MIKAIFFDSAGVLLKLDFKLTITNYEKTHVIDSGALYKAMHDYQYWKDFTLGKITEEKYFQEVMNNFGSDLNVEEIKTLIRDDVISNSELFDFIKQLKAKFITGIISNNPREWFDYWAEKYNWSNIFKIKIISSFFGVRKPDIKIFQAALKEANVEPEESIYIDDRSDIIVGAEQLGIKILVYKNSNQFKKELNFLLN
ncbi:MAG: HAD family phosphatase [Ignavibacterium sp.]|nr:HAD family phosphatase [Ignavibacterium sp.]